MHKRLQDFSISKENGFTLVELVVVIAILGILAGVLFRAINPAAINAKSRDVRRMTDLDAMSSAMNLALAEGEAVLLGTPALVNFNNSGSGSQASDSTGWLSYTVPTGLTGMGRYLAALPLDPQNETPYLYYFASDGTNFELNAVLESPDNDVKETTDGGDDPDRYEVGSSLFLMSP